MRRYPDTPYAADARVKIDLVRDHLAGKEMQIGRFYQRRRQWLAAVVRFRTVIDELQRVKPASAKGRYVRRITVSSTMGPGVSIDTGGVEAAAKA